MKFKIYDLAFWTNLILILMLTCISIFMGYGIFTGSMEVKLQDIPAVGGIIAFFAIGYYSILIHLKAYFSTIIITANGVDVRFLRRSWFKASWDEIKQIGAFSVDYSFNVRWGMACIYFSKVPITIDESIFRFGTPCSSVTDYQTVFLDAYHETKLYAEILKYIDEEQIIQDEYSYSCGFLKTKRKKKNEKKWYNV